MNVLILNGSPRKTGNTTLALAEMERIFAEEGIGVETVRVGNQAVRGCMACNSCGRTGKCVFDDVVNQIAPKFEAADGLVVASPVYYASANATLIDTTPEKPALSAPTKTVNTETGEVIDAGTAAPAEPDDGMDF